ncbi:MAG TPA: AAA family ATPase, partial [Thermomicrobiales bacterium]|nr:AAA family ATPase [Thermomicrobiales bacterium]
MEGSASEAETGVDAGRDRHVRARPVGRARERGNLRGVLRQMLDGHGRLVLVSGEAGIGKTTLVADLADDAEAQGCLAMWGHAYDLSVTPPYGPWLELLRRYPGQDDGFPPLPPFVDDARMLATVTSQQALFSAVTAFFQDVARRMPLVLVLDDLHWADQASLDFLRFLAREIGSHRILIVATYRSDEIDQGHPLYALLPPLVRESGVERLDVRGLDTEDHLALVASRYAMRGEDTDRLAQHLETHAEGNPLFALELLRSLEEEHILHFTDGGWVLDDIAQTRVPPLLRQVIDRRLSRLDNDARALLQVAAIIGQQASLDLWQQVTEATDEALILAIEQSAAAALLEEVESGASYRFQHALFREALYAEVAAPRRRTWHRRVAEALAARPHPDPDAVAFHFQQAGDARATDWLLQAARRAKQSYARRTAASRLEAAARMLQQQRGADPREYYLLLYEIGSILRYTSSPDVTSYLAEASAAARQAGDAAVAAIADAELGYTHLLQGDVQRGIGEIERALAECRRLLRADPTVFDHAAVEFSLNAEAITLADRLATRTAILLLAGAFVGSLDQTLPAVEQFGTTVDEVFQRDATVPYALTANGIPYQLADLTWAIAMADALLGRVADAQRRFSYAEQIFSNDGEHYLVMGVNFWSLTRVELPYLADNPAATHARADAARAALSRSLNV